MKYRCLYIKGSTSITNGRSELPQNCMIRGCRGEFDRLKDILVCYTAESGNPIGIMRWRKGRERALSLRRIPKAIYIDSDPSTIKLGKRILKGVCEVPDDIPTVAKLEEAKNLILSNKPDLVIIDWYSRNGNDERIDLLDAIKSIDPQIKVVLYSDSYSKEKCVKLGVNFDCILYKHAGEHFDLKEAVSRLTKEILAPKQLLEKSPEHSQEKAIKKLLIIEDEEELLRAVSILMSDICQVPKDMRAIKSLNQAKTLLELHSPDIVICDKQFDLGNDKAHHELLDFIKERNQNTKVILWSCNACADDYASATNAFDSVFAKTDFAGLIVEVKKQTE